MPSYNDTKKEQEIHLKSELERLRIEPFQESSGKMIGNLIVYKQSKELLVYARRWLEQFPNHEYAPNLVGHWLDNSDSNQAMYMAEYYLRNFSLTFKLRELLRAIGISKRSPQRIYNLIEARISRQRTEVSSH
ncbi:hypothetical protein BH10CYA1_BH10CYA1_64180 [soil metagenome]